MRLAYADPPYPGCAHLYPENTEVDHRELIERLCTYDGWALSTNEPRALQEILAMCPPGVRVLAWCKSNAPPFFLHPFPSWEPVICVPARTQLPDMRVASHIVTPKPGGFIDREAGPFPGIKPAPFCEWVIRCLGAEPDDTLDDLFPGTGSMTRAWDQFQRQLPLWSKPTGGSLGHREKIRRALATEQESMEMASGS